jgi:[acyl-carrier-protein] S-malonyltransferase
VTSMCAPVAWLLPGQGVDWTGLFDWSIRSARVRGRVEQAGQLAECDALRLLTTGQRALFRSAVLQPVFIAGLLGIAEELCLLGPSPDLCVGHSLGQLAAFAVAGALDFELAIELAALRGRAMGEAARQRPGGMIALTADGPLLEQALELGRRSGGLCVGGRNATERWILSGDVPALLAVLARFVGVRLRVEGAWHSPAMASAVAVLEGALERAAIQQPRLPVIDGETGRFLQTPEQIRACLVRQLTCPFDWTRVCGALGAHGVAQFVTLGPGKALAEFTRENLGRGVEILGTDTFELARRSLGGSA